MLPARVALALEVELCTAKRPSTTLRGSSQSYLDKYKALEKEVGVCVCVLCLPQPCARWLSQLGQVRITYKSVHYEPAGAAGPRQLSPKHQSVNCKR